MNDEPEHRLPLDGRLFDLLVDGELDSIRRSELLSRLDTAPDGWRRCALAFLEAQAWRSDLRTAIDAAVPANSRGAGVVANRKSLVARLWRLNVLALCLCLAFGAGWLIRRGGGDRHDGRLAAPTSLLAARDATTNQEAEATTRAIPESDKNGPQVPASMRMAGILALQVDDHGQLREVRVPVLDAPGIDIRSLLEQAPPTRSSAIQALERRGHKVETHRQLLTVDLKDGRKLLVPVDQVDVHFANRVYQ
jgi:hypothetical protein